MNLNEIFTTATEILKKDPVGVMQYGLLGVYLKAQTEKQTGRDGSEPIGPLCPQICPLNVSHCKECVAMQRYICSELETVQLIEKKIKEGVFDHSEKVERNNSCHTCGAPIKRGEIKCPYCDVLYDQSTVLDGIPNNAIEQEQFLLKKCVDFYALYLEWDAIRRKNMCEASESTSLSKMGGWINSFADSHMQMDAMQLKQGANKYGVGYVEYVTGVITGKYKTNMLLELEDIAERNRKYEARNAEIERERQEKLRRINNERNKIMGDMIYSKHIY